MKGKKIYYDFVPHFAWRPVFCEDTQRYVWLENVVRYRVFRFSASNYYESIHCDAVRDILRFRTVDPRLLESKKK